MNKKHKIEKFLKKQAPSLLTYAAIAGMITTVALAIKATPKTVRLCEEVRQTKEEPSASDYVKKTWTCYIPMLVSGSVTIACILEANVINKHRQAALTSAYILIDQSYKDYKKKVKEVIGVTEEHRVQEAIVKDKYKNTEGLTGEKLVFYMDYQERFFERTMLEVRDAEYELNRRFASDGEVRLNDFFELLDLPKNKAGEILGWSQEASYDFFNYFWIEFEHELVTMDDDMECYVINLPYSPSALYLPY